jgi:hypothetical protein
VGALAVASWFQLQHRAAGSDVSESNDELNGVFFCYLRHYAIHIWQNEAIWSGNKEIDRSKIKEMPT